MRVSLFPPQGCAIGKRRTRLILYGGAATAFDAPQQQPQIVLGGMVCAFCARYGQPEPVEQIGCRG